MNNTKSALIISLIVVVAIGAWFVSNSSNPMSESPTEIMEESTFMEEEIMTEGELSQDAEETAMNENSGFMADMITSTSAGSYQEYTPEVLARVDGTNVLLFFHASWCPTCRAADKNIIKGADSIPTGVHILKLDFDSETALRKKYGVTTQHTFVEIDAEGNMVQKFSGLRKLDDILAKIQ